ncbi:MAG TPA: hypothetical protein VK603_26010 [Candidatus Saccharimonadales bacterium]|nr:hypothetical protein [Candidatus Saccharimonadales bacterium]
MTAKGTLHEQLDHRRFVGPFGNHETKVAIAKALSPEVAIQPYQYIAGPSLAGLTRK